jgi:Glyoxalase/Bleomycin resistance protein/Dioxygenase superfamily
VWLRNEANVSMQSDRSAELKFVVTNTLIVGDIHRSVAFYRDVLGVTVLREGKPAILRLATYGFRSMVAAARPTTSLKSSLRRRAIKTFPE